MERGSGVVPRRNHLHRRDVQERRQDDVLQRGVAGGPLGPLNSSLEGNTRRAIDFHEGEQIDEEALEALIRGAVALNESGASASPALSLASAVSPPVAPALDVSAPILAEAGRSDHQYLEALGAGS